MLATGGRCLPAWRARALSTPGVWRGTGALNCFFSADPDGRVEWPPIASKVASASIFSTASASGSRRPAAAAGAIRRRETRRVARDVRCGYVTDEAARKQYRVIADQRRIGLGRHDDPACGTQALSATAGTERSWLASTSVEPLPTVLLDRRSRSDASPSARRPHTRQRGGRVHRADPEGPTRSMTCGSIVHGTTVGTNALLERKGARIGVIATARLPRRARNATARSASNLGPLGRFYPDRGRDSASRSTNACLPTAPCGRLSIPAW